MAKKNLLTRFLFNQKTMAFLGLAIIVLISFPIAKNISRRYEVNKEVEELEEEIKLIEQKNSDLQKLIAYLSSDQYAEEQARLNFGLKKPGEEVAVIDIHGDNIKKENFQDPKGENSLNGEVDDNPAKSIYNIPGIDKARSKKSVSNPERWWNYFFNF